MPIMFFIVVAITGLAVTAGVIGIICEIAYEQGYDDACRDWRDSATIRYADSVVEAEVVEDHFEPFSWN